MFFCFNFVRRYPVYPVYPVHFYSDEIYRIDWIKNQQQPLRDRKVINKRLSNILALPV